MASATSSSSHDGPTLRSAGRISLLDLPREALETILFYVTPRDLAILSRVSSSFHDLAAAQLYRAIDPFFGADDIDDDRSDDEAAIDHLADDLETVITSDYNYGQFIKEINIDVYDYDSHARGFEYPRAFGKLINVLIVSTFKKVVSLETFRWNVRAELGESALIALSKMKSLQNLHLRLQPGPSRHHFSSRASKTPPDAFVPSLTPGQSFNSQFNHPNQITFTTMAPTSSYPFNVSLVPPPSHPTYVQAAHPPPKSQKIKVVHKARVFDVAKSPTNISLFSNLKSLAVLDIDSMDYISEITKCVASSASTLKTLKLSLSESMAMQARKKKTTPENVEADVMVDPEDLPPFSDVEPTPFAPTFPHPPSHFGGAGSPTDNPADISRHKATQEKILARIFGVDTTSDVLNDFSVKFERGLFEAYLKAETLAAETLHSQEDQEFVRTLRAITENIEAEAHANGLSGRPLKALLKIEKAAIKYLEAKEKKEERDTGGSQLLESSLEPKKGPQKTKENGVNQTGKVIPTTASRLTQQAAKIEGQSNANVEVDSLPSEEKETESEELEAASAKRTLFGTSKNEEDRVSDIVDIEHPDKDEDSDEGPDQEFESGIESERDGESKTPPSPALLGKADIQEAICADLENRIRSSVKKGKERVKDISQAGEKKKAKAPQDSEFENYMRDHHGFRLDSLSLCYIPVKGMILCRAIDVFTLKHISLLHVGDQSGFWGALKKLGESCPLKLTSIHTDHVTAPFLTLANSLEKVTELYLVQRSAKGKRAEVPMTNVSLEDIRLQILAKHILTLQHLMIRNDHNDTWSLDRKSILMLTSFGRNLRELCVVLNFKSWHLFMQHLAGLQQVYALQILFQHRESSDAQARDLHLDVLDVMMHCPSLKIEYLGACAIPSRNNYVAQIHRDGSTNNRACHKILPKDVALVSDEGKRPSLEPNPFSPIGMTDENMKDLLRRIESGDESVFEQIHGHFPRISAALMMKDVQGVKMWERENWTMCL